LIKIVSKEEKLRERKIEGENDRAQKGKERYGRNRDRARFM